MRGADLGFDLVVGRHPRTGSVVSEGSSMSSDDLRRQRLAMALRDNLRRRKAQSRARKAGGDGLTRDAAESGSVTSAQPDGSQDRAPGSAQGGPLRE